ncbi:hypothetical protein [Bacillus bombysepticus]|uniref:COG1470 family protein n=1 Tax=Bacillus bombysepticus TaxID=658666 RepID=UPI00301A94E8
MKKIYFILISFITATLFSFNPFNVSAAENVPEPDKFGINVSPAEITINEKIDTKGENKLFEITVKNPGTKEQTFKVVPEKLLKPDITTFKLKPGEAQKIKFRFDFSKGYDEKTKKETITFLSSNDKHQTINAAIKVNFSIKPTEKSSFNVNDKITFNPYYLLLLLLIPIGYFIYRKKKKSN